MKKIFTFLLVLLFTIGAFSQVPEKMSYQAIVRDADGELVKSTSVGIKISILQGSESGTEIYVETHSKTTNENGLVTLEIGGGTPVTGTFAEIDWSAGKYFLKTETDPDGGTDYTISGTSQILSVPYALYSVKGLRDVSTQSQIDALKKQVQDLSDFSYSQTVPPANGLVAYYPFNGNANDESGNGNNGIVNGATLITDRFNKLNSAYHFDDTQNITTTFTGVLGNADRSISFWAKIAPSEAGGGVCSYGGSFGTGFSPTLLSGNLAHMDISDATVTYQASKVNDGSWHHYVYIFSTQYGTSLNGIKIFQDGRLLTAIMYSYNYDSYTVNTSSDSPFSIGGGSISIDDIRFYNRIVTNAEIQQMYHEGGYTSPAAITDIDGNNYSTVKIGTQVWMAQNLKTTKYNDGTAIPLVTVTYDWKFLLTPGYCWYNNDQGTYGSNYGGLYNWFAVSATTNGGKNVCPTGWHVPTDAEWTVMEDHLIANGFNYDGTTAGNKLAKALGDTSSLWTSSTVTGTVGNTDYPEKRNATGFSALPGGNRFGPNEFDDFSGASNYGNWWSASEYDGYTAVNHYIIYNETAVGTWNNNKQLGFSVRCLKD
jgi:uncharacterized protein (TIGR02145 family)